MSINTEYSVYAGYKGLCGQLMDALNWQIGQIVVSFSVAMNMQ